MLTKQQMSVARKVYGRCYCRRCATSGKITGGSERFVKGVYAGIFCSECWALDERSGNTPNGSVLLNGPLTAEAERNLAETPNPVVTRHAVSDTALGLSVESSFEVRQRTNKGV